VSEGVRVTMLNSQFFNGLKHGTTGKEDIQL